MNSFLRNPELKLIIIKLIIIHVLFAILIFVFLNNEMINLNKSIVNNDTALIGNILSSHPELEEEIVHYLTKGATQKEILEGRRVLNKYGYNENMKVNSQPLLKKFYIKFQLRTLFIIILYGFPLTILIYIEYKKLFKKIRNISEASEAVVDGNYSIILQECGEGDFAILGHNFNMMTNRLKLSFEKLQEDKVFLKNIISDISHQLKTPLTSLLTINELLLERKEMPEEIKIDFLEKSKSQLDRMEWLILNLLKVARLEAGAINFRNEKVPLRNPIMKAITSLKIKAEEKKQNIILKEGIEEIYFYGDEEWTSEAFVNLLKNAIEHTGYEGEIIIEVSETPLFSRVVISDNGEGIEKKDIPHIFERFYKGSNSIKAVSVGIGLSLTKLIIEAQDGTIAVSSEKGKGTSFIITFLKGIV